MLSINKKSTSSGFENEYNAFLNKTLNFEAFPSYRSNGSLITNISGNSFTIILKDSLNNVISTTNASWNSTCGKEGCYLKYILESILRSLLALRQGDSSACLSNRQS